MTKTTGFTLSVTLALTAAAPITTNGRNFSGSVSASLQTATSGASIYYTTNGSTPTQSSTLYTGAMSLTSSAIVKAKAFKSGSNPSAEASASFTFAGVGTAKGITRYVDNQLASNCTSGNYSIANRKCTGSDGNAYMTLEAAVSGLSGGDIVNIRQSATFYAGTGSYNKFLLTLFPVASLGNRLIVQTYPGDSGSVFINGVDGANATRFVTFRGNSNRNLIIDGRGGPGTGVGQGVANAFGVRIENAEIKNCRGHCIQGVGSSEFINLDVHDAGKDPAFCVSGGGTCYGVYTGNGSQYSNNLFDGGRYHHNPGWGMQCYSTCSNTIIRNIRFDHNAVQGGVIMTSGAGSEIYNVVADNNAGAGIWLAGDGVVGYNLTTYANGVGIQISSFGNITVRNTLALDGISDRDGLGYTGSNNITSGSASSYLVDAANGNFQLIPRSKIKDVGADLSSERQ